MSLTVTIKKYQDFHNFLSVKYWWFLRTPFFSISTSLHLTQAKAISLCRHKNYISSFWWCHCHMILKWLGLWKAVHTLLFVVFCRTHTIYVIFHSCWFYDVLQVLIYFLCQVCQIVFAWLEFLNFVFVLRLFCFSDDVILLLNHY